MGFSYNVNVLNQKGSPAIYTDIFANRPAFGFAGRLFIANDTAAIYEDTGTAWVLIANVSSGAGTLQQVTTNGNTSNVGISVTAGGVSTNSATITSLTQGSVPFVGAAGLITQDNANLFFDDTNNRLGINTNTPSNNLDVHGTGTSPLIAVNNTAGNQALIAFLNTGAARWRIGNTAGNFFDIINMFTSTSAISINSAGNVVTLIGALNGTSCVFSSTITSQTNGSTFGNSTIGGNPLIVKSNAVSRAIQLVNTLGGAAEILCGGSATTSFVGFGTVLTADAFIIYNDGSNRSNGDVGMWGASTRNLNFFDTTNNNINAQIQYSEVNSNTGQLLFKTNNTGTSTTKLAILESGFVGIGTATPSTTLDVVGSGIFSGSLTANAGTFTGAITGNSSLEAGKSGSLTFGDLFVDNTNKTVYIGRQSTTGGDNSIFIVRNRLNSTYFNVNPSNDFAFFDNCRVAIGSAVDDTVNKLQVTGSGVFSGNLAINSGLASITAIPSTNQAILRFDGSDSKSSYFGKENSAGNYTWASGGTAYATVICAYNQTTPIQLGHNSPEVSIANGGAITIVNLAGTGSRAVIADANGLLSAPVSDILVKENIEPLKYGLETIMKLNAVQFEFIEGYKNYGEGLQIGAIAQEVEQIIPEAVFTTPSTGLKGIDYNQFNGIYIKAIQDQQKIIESLIKRIELLENK